MRFYSLTSIALNVHVDDIARVYYVVDDINELLESPPRGIRTRLHDPIMII